MNAFWVCLCLSAYGRPFGACCPWQHTRLTAPLFHTRRSRRLPKRAFSDTLPYHYITPLPTRSSRIPLTAPNLHTSHVPLTTHTHTSRVPHTTHTHTSLIPHTAPLPTRSSRIPLTAPNLHTSHVPLTTHTHTSRVPHTTHLHTSRVPHTKFSSHTTPAPELPQTIRRCVIFYI